jgi:hypothetical protein
MFTKKINIFRIPINGSTIDLKSFHIPSQIQSNYQEQYKHESICVRVCVKQVPSIDDEDDATPGEKARVW